LAKASRINGTAAVSPKRASRTGNGGNLVRVAVERSRCAGDDHVPRLGGIESAGGVQDHPARTADHRPRAFRRDELDVEFTADEVATRDEHFERGDRVKRVEAVEQ
jgi:hypothetical protein